MWIQASHHNQHLMKLFKTVNFIAKTLMFLIEHVLFIRVKYIFLKECGDYSIIIS